MDSSSSSTSTSSVMFDSQNFNAILDGFSYTLHALGDRRACSRSPGASCSRVLRQLPGRALAPVRWLTIAYIDAFRGVPLLLVLLIIFGSFGAAHGRGGDPE